ncbi:glycoside hydrolase family 32 protein [Sphingobacterium phlebotomi]|uniref:beta-fructofuranosidase n=1 Tax=Sphingobacterium phlebotomi TaxID=2605433 RepID=A0A5D4H032_9SPHI|nr:glycoside hydrolase family 32 protein [Sphingobacterium phlebotomi]TYR33633.1 glycoside hydrolase family 32 protein [Sphingobacterium phlebotomi]
MKIRLELFAIAAQALFICGTSIAQDYTSKVPYFRFDDVKDVQDKKIQNNPLVKRFNLSRDVQKSNLLRPTYHYINPEGRLNDPNGLCYWNGNWHLFYQAYPPEDTRQHWGHAVSKDLVHWTDLPYAIYPNPEEKVYSGATMVEKDRVIAMYHGTKVGTMVAISSDPLLLNWDKTPESPVIKMPKPDEKLPYNVFDPNIWKEGDSYYTVLAGTRPEGPGGKNIRANFLFKSKDLASWEYMHEFIENDLYSFVGDDGACPYFLPIGKEGKYIFLHFSHMTGGKYLIGDYDTQRHKFVVTDGGQFNHGPVGFGGVHAPSAFTDQNGDVVVMFNMNSGKRIHEGNYTETMTLPRLLSLDDQGRLSQRPVAALETLRYNKFERKNILLPKEQFVLIPEAAGSAKEIVMKVDLKGASYLELNVLSSPDKSEFTRVMFYKNGGVPERDIKNGRGRYSAIAIDNSNGSLANDVTPRVTETADVFIGKEELVELRVFIDKSIVEVFVNGRQCIAVGTYPTLKESDLFSVKAHGKDAEIVSFESYNMKSIY